MNPGSTTRPSRSIVRVFLPQGLDIGIRADRDNPVAVHRQRLRDRARGVHCNDLAVYQYEARLHCLGHHVESLSSAARR